MERTLELELHSLLFGGDVDVDSATSRKYRLSVIRESGVPMFNGLNGLQYVHIRYS